MLIKQVTSHISVSDNSIKQWEVNSEHADLLKNLPVKYSDIEGPKEYVIFLAADRIYRIEYNKKLSLYSHLYNKYIEVESGVNWIKTKQSKTKEYTYIQRVDCEIIDNFHELVELELLFNRIKPS